MQWSAPDVSSTRFSRIGLTSSVPQFCRYIHTLIQQEVESGIPISRIVLAGLSQGGALVLSSLNKETCGIAGIIGTFRPYEISYQWIQTTVFW